MARLREPGGCPWDAEQTHRSLAGHLLEETYEALEAIDSGNMDHLQEELGDLLLQVVFHAQIAGETGVFGINDVVGGLVGKLIQRHPHVFGEAAVKDSSEVVASWESLKSQQKGRTSLIEGLPETLPALIQAHKVLRRLAGAGRQVAGSVQRLQAATARMDGEVTDEALGELLMETVALAAASGIDSEGALRRHSRRALEAAENPAP